MKRILGKREAEHLDNIKDVENDLINGRITNQQFNDRLDELRADYQEQGQ